MKKRMFALLINLYLIQAGMYAIYKMENTVILTVVILMIISAFILIIVNIICAVLSMKNYDDSMDKIASINNTVLIFKLLAMPFFVLNFYFWLLFTGAGLVVPGLQLLLLLVPVGAGFSYLVLLAGSSYSIVSLVKLYRSGKITNKQTIKHIILQLVFVVDTIDYLFLHNEIRKICKSQKTEEGI